MIVVILPSLGSRYLNGGRSVAVSYVVTINSTGVPSNCVFRNCVGNLLTIFKFR